MSTRSITLPALYNSRDQRIKTVTAFLARGPPQTPLCAARIVGRRDSPVFPGSEFLGDRFAVDIRITGDLEMFVELQPALAPSRIAGLRGRRWRSFSESLGALRYAAAPYFLRDLARSLEESLPLDERLLRSSRPDFLPPIYAPEGPWEWFGPRRHEDYAVRSRLIVPPSGLGENQATTWLPRFLSGWRPFTDPVTLIVSYHGNLDS